MMVPETPKSKGPPKWVLILTAILFLGMGPFGIGLFLLVWFGIWTGYKLFRGDAALPYDRPIGQMVIATAFMVALGGLVGFGGVLVVGWLELNEVRFDMPGPGVFGFVASIVMGGLLGIAAPSYAWWRWFEEHDNEKYSHTR